jgi:hypothetical protein
MTRNIKKAVALVVALCAIAGCIASVMQRLHASRNQHRAEATTYGLNYMRAAITVLVLEEGRLPSPNPESISQALREYDPLLLREYQRKRQFATTLSGRDGWGQSLIYELAKGDHGDLELNIRSVGGNGVDERGAGDDIERTVRLPTSSN